MHSSLSPLIYRQLESLSKGCVFFIIQFSFIESSASQPNAPISTK